MEDAVAGECSGRICNGRRETSSGSGVERPSRKDRPVGAGDRFFCRRARSHGRCERKKMIDKAHGLPVVRQVQLLDLSRSTVYYRPQAMSECDLQMVRRIDKLHLDHPFAGARMLRDMLRLDKIVVGSKHINADEEDGHRSALPKGQHQSAEPGAPDLPLPLASPHHRSPRTRSGPWIRRTSRCNADSSI